MQDSFDPLTLVFLALAAFILWKLRSVLGQRTGNERPPYDPFARKVPPKPDKAPADAEPGAKVIPMPQPADARERPQSVQAFRWEGVAKEGSAVAAGLDQISAAEPDFDVKRFLEGARAAYEAIVVAFSQGDRATLRSLLSKEVFDGFDRVIAAREKNGERAETTFVSIAQPEITDVEVKNGTAEVTLRFTSSLVSVVRDAAGEVVDGDSEAVVEVIDLWTFSRAPGSRDPNWRLVATGGPAPA